MSFQISPWLLFSLSPFLSAFFSTNKNTEGTSDPFSCLERHVSYVLLSADYVRSGVSSILTTKTSIYKISLKTLDGKNGGLGSHDLPVRTDRRHLFNRDAPTIHPLQVIRNTYILCSKLFEIQIQYWPKNTCKKTNTLHTINLCVVICTLTKPSYTDKPLFPFPHCAKAPALWRLPQNTGFHPHTTQTPRLPPPFASFPYTMSKQLFGNTSYKTLATKNIIILKNDELALWT